VSTLGAGAEAPVASLVQKPTPAQLPDLPARHSLFSSILSKLDRKCCLVAAGKPSGKVAEAIERDLGGFDKFVEAFKAAGGSSSRLVHAGHTPGTQWPPSTRQSAAMQGLWAVLQMSQLCCRPASSQTCLSPLLGRPAGATQFGSGWAWLSVNKAGKLEVTKTPNAENPWVHGATPILTMDVWCARSGGWQACMHCWWHSGTGHSPRVVGAAVSLACALWSVAQGARLLPGRPEPPPRLHLQVSQPSPCCSGAWLCVSCTLIAHQCKFRKLRLR
jgi:hypothetical protein